MLLRDYLRTAIKNAGFSHSDISKMPTGTKVATACYQSHRRQR